MTDHARQAAECEIQQAITSATADLTTTIAELRAEVERLTARWQACAKFLNGHCDANELAQLTGLFNHRNDDLALKIIDKHLATERLTRELDDLRHQCRELELGWLCREAERDEAQEAARWLQSCCENMAHNACDRFDTGHLAKYPWLKDGT